MSGEHDIQPDLYPTKGEYLPMPRRYTAQLALARQTGDSNTIWSTYLPALVHRPKLRVIDSLAQELGLQPRKFDVVLGYFAFNNAVPTLGDILQLAQEHSHIQLPLPFRRNEFTQVIQLHTAQNSQIGKSPYLKPFAFLCGNEEKPQNVISYEERFITQDDIANGSAYFATQDVWNAWDPFPLMEFKHLQEILSDPEKIWKNMASQGLGIISNEAFDGLVVNAFLIAHHGQAGLDHYLQSDPKVRRNEGLSTREALARLVPSVLSTKGYQEIQRYCEAAGMDGEQIFHQMVEYLTPVWFTNVQGLRASGSFVADQIPNPRIAIVHERKNPESDFYEPHPLFALAYYRQLATFIPWYTQNMPWREDQEKFLREQFLTILRMGKNIMDQGGAFADDIAIALNELTQVFFAINKQPQQSESREDIEPGVFPPASYQPHEDQTHFPIKPKGRHVSGQPDPGKNPQRRGRK